MEIAAEQNFFARRHQNHLAAVGPDTVALAVDAEIQPAFQQDDEVDVRIGQAAAMQVLFRRGAPSVQTDAAVQRVEMVMPAQIVVTVALLDKAHEMAAVDVQSAHCRVFNRDCRPNDNIYPSNGQTVP